jgi:hypothetical protein
MLRLQAILVIAATFNVKYSGSRDVRYITCQTACSFRCADPEARLGGGRVAKRAARKPYDLKWEVSDYARELRSALRTETYRQPVEEVQKGAEFANATRGGWLALWRWTCEDNCRYLCMIDNVAVRETQQEPIVQYYGRWPFRRVCGVEEFASSGVSLLKAGLHARWVRTLRGDARFLAIASANLNLASAMHHARSVAAFERWDYTSFGVNLVAWTMIPANRLGLRRLGPGLLFLYLPYGAMLAAGQIDYGKHMALSVLFGAMTSVLWVVFIRRARRAGERQWLRMLIPCFGWIVVLPFELGDFPPVFGLVDAHACFHFGIFLLSFGPRVNLYHVFLPHAHES